MYEIDLGDGYIAVPETTVALNGGYLPSLNIIDQYHGYLCVIQSDINQALMGVDGLRPYRFDDLEECRLEIAIRCRFKQPASSCETGSVVNCSAMEPARTWKQWLFPAKHCKHPEPNFLFKDVITQRIATKLDWTDLLRVIFTRTIVVVSRTATEHEPGNICSHSELYIGTKSDLV